jgi:predicted dehydrogenase
MSTVLRIGVVGGGLIAQTIHLPRIARLGERRFVALIPPLLDVRDVAITMASAACPSERPAPERVP